MPKTIYSYIHSDDLSGSRIITMDNCFCKLYNIKRNDNKFFQDLKDELKKPALYILLNIESNKAYIGETDDFLSRINQHIQRKAFWDEVFAFMSTDDALSKTEVQYLEYLAYDKAFNVASFDLSENTQVPTKPHMSLIQKGKTEEFFKLVQFLTEFAGCDIFKQKKKESYPIQHSNIMQLAESKTKPEDLKGRIHLSLNGEGKYTKGDFVRMVIKKYIEQNPSISFIALKTIFHNNLLGSWNRWNLIESDIEKAKSWKEQGENCRRHLIKDNHILVCDGVPFVVCNQWDYNNLINILCIVESMGWEYKIIKE